LNFAAAKVIVALTRNPQNRSLVCIGRGVRFFFGLARTLRLRSMIDCGWLRGLRNTDFPWPCLGIATPIADRYHRGVSFSRRGVNMKPTILCNAFFFVATLLGVVAFAQGPAKCVREKSPEIKKGNAHLQYDSRVDPKDDRFMFFRCVFNHDKNTRIWVDWVGTGAKSHSDKNGIVDAQFEWPTNDNYTKKTDLIYGVARVKADSTYVEAKEFNAGGETTVPGSLRSYAKMGITLRGDESNPASLVIADVDVEFESSATNLGNGKYLYTYSWRDRLADKRERKDLIVVNWPDDFVRQAIGESAKAGAKSLTVLSSSATGTFAIDKIAPEVTMVTVELHAPEARSPKSTARVSILRPRKSL
jgi:hypothetical protein